MGKKDPRIDTYIAKSQPFAQPVLNHLREIVHKACPEAEETIKWGMPHFEYRGIICSMASFKAHAVFGFFKASLLSDPHKILEKVGNTTMGQLGKIKSMNDLPDDTILIAYIKEAAELNRQGIKAPARPNTKKEVEVPEYFLAALNKNKKALEVFENSAIHTRRNILNGSLKQRERKHGKNA